HLARGLLALRRLLAALLALALDGAGTRLPPALLQGHDQLDAGEQLGAHHLEGHLLVVVTPATNRGEAREPECVALFEMRRVVGLAVANGNRHPEVVVAVAATGADERQLDERLLAALDDLRLL